MNNNEQIIDWNSSDVLMQIVRNIQDPLTSIIDANNQLTQETHDIKSQKNANNIILSNSQNIAKLIKEVLKVAKANSINLSSKTEPVIFKIYNTNQQVKSICGENIDQDKVFASDKNWLLIFEKEVFKRIKDCQLNLFDLSYYMAVSERQLHRKIKSLLCITPNKYIRILKLYQAKKILDNYMYNTVSEVSYAVGYNDTHYFSKLFFQQYGMSPKEILYNMK